MKDMVEVVCDATMRHAARFVEQDQNLDAARLTRYLREEVKTGYAGLMAEMKEANDAFFGNEGMLPGSQRRLFGLRGKGHQLATK